MTIEYNLIQDNRILELFINGKRVEYKVEGVELVYPTKAALDWAMRGDDQCKNVDFLGLKYHNFITFLPAKDVYKLAAFLKKHLSQQEYLRITAEIRFDFKKTILSKLRRLFKWK